MAVVRAQMVNFTPFSKLAEKLSSFDREVRIFTEYILNQEGYRNILIAYNIENLNIGKRADGSDIEKTPVGRQKSTRYERYTRYLKEKRGDLSDVVTARGETGQFQGAIDVKVGSDSLIFIDRDPKAELLESVWGNLLGMSEEQLFDFANLIKPEYERFIEKYFK